MTGEDVEFRTTSWKSDAPLRILPNESSSKCVDIFIDFGSDDSFLRWKADFEKNTKHGETQYSV